MDDPHCVNNTNYNVAMSTLAVSTFAVSKVFLQLGIEEEEEESGL